MVVEAADIYTFNCSPSLEGSYPTHDRMREADVGRNSSRVPTCWYVLFFQREENLRISRTSMPWSYNRNSCLLELYSEF